MKKRIALVLSIFFSLALQAQMNKKSILLESYFSYGSNKMQPITQNTISGNVGIAVAKAVKQNVFWGISAGFAPFKTETPYVIAVENVVNKGNSYFASIFCRKFRKLSDKFYFLGQLDIGLSGANSHQESAISLSPISYSRNRDCFVMLTPGLSYKASKKLFIEIIVPAIIKADYLKFATTDIRTATKSKQENISVYSNLNPSNALSNLNIGFFFLF